MVSRETCPQCNGNKWITVYKNGKQEHKQCNRCSGKGYLIKRF